MEELNLSTPALLFSAVSLILLAYTNRFLSYAQLVSWTNRIGDALKSKGMKKVSIDTVMTAAPAVLKEFKKSEEYGRLTGYGVKLSYICPLMYMNNPMCGSMPVVTCSNKLRTYTSARYFREEKLLDIITGGAL